MSFRLRKKELKEEYWPRLIKETKRVHYLKTDFDKVSQDTFDHTKSSRLRTDRIQWVDEDEQDGAPDDDALGGGMGGMPGMGGMGEDGGFGGIGKPLDSFSPYINNTHVLTLSPDFSKLGGGAGGMPDLSAMGGEGDEDDDDMPDLEGDEEGDVKDKAGEEAEPKAEGKGKAKIEVVS